jgi:hypothetical protein
MWNLILTFIIWGVPAGMVMPAASVSPQDPEQAYRASYHRWRAAIDANPALGEAFWLDTDNGPAALRNATAGLVSAGPNLVPFIVREFRTETDQLRLYRLMLLLKRVSGISLYFNSGEENFYAAMPKFKARFLSQWDSGDFENATVLLRKAWKDPDPTNAVEKIDPKSLTPFLRYGVFAIPFIAESLEKQNSPELFAAFLNITGIITRETDQYAEYLENPSRFYPTREHKLTFVKGWAAKNLNKVDRLKDLHEKIMSMAAR